MEIIMNSNDLYNNLKELWEEFDSNHNVFVDKGNKAAGSRARKAIGEIKKLVTEYRKASVSECIMNIASLAGHLAFGLIAFSFLVKDIFWLRIVSILASLFSVFYNYLIPLEPMWLAINWNFIFIAVNLYHIAVILYEKREVKMDAKNQELYDTLFSEMTPVEYLKISRAAKWELVKAGERIITQGMPVPDLYLIYNGTVDVIVDNEQIAELKDGEFVGEMSFLTEKVATATCKVKYDAQCLVWKQKEFKELLKRNPSLYFTIQSVLSSQVSDKLVKSSK